MLKLMKIKAAHKTLQNNNIITWLTELLLESEPSDSPLIEKINHPNKDFFILICDNIIIPAYIKVKEDEALVLWVHKDYRTKGYAKFMINTLNIKYAIAAPSSISFWEKIGFRRISSLNSGPSEMRRN